MTAAGRCVDFELVKLISTLLERDLIHHPSCECSVRRAPDGRRWIVDERDDDG